MRNSFGTRVKDIKRSVFAKKLLYPQSFLLIQMSDSELQSHIRIHKNA
jgi:hypothetical protein